MCDCNDDDYYPDWAVDEMQEEIEKLKAALKDSAQHVALVLKGIRQGVIKDAAMIDTNLDAPTLEVRPISKMLADSLARSSAALSPANPA